jgi:hypothetical protein
VVLLIACLITCSAPLAAPVTWFWRRANRENLSALPVLYDFLCRIGMVAATVQTVLVVLVTMIYHFSQ